MMTDERLNALIDLLYQRAIEGDSRTGLALVKLYDKSLKLRIDEQVGLVFLPEMSESDTKDFINSAEPETVTRVVPARGPTIKRTSDGSFADDYEEMDD